MSVATSTAIAIGAGVSAGTGLAGAAISAHSQGQAAENSLDFQKQQAENDWNNQQLAQQANYQLYAAKQRANNSIRAAMGLAPVDIPNYVAGVDPRFTGPPAQPPTPQQQALGVRPIIPTMRGVAGA